MSKPKEELKFELSFPHTCKSTGSNSEVCLACIETRIKKSEYYHETPDMHDLMLLKDAYGGYW